MKKLILLTLLITLLSGCTNEKTEVETNDGTKDLEKEVVSSENIDIEMTDEEILQAKMLEDYDYLWETLEENLGYLRKKWF